MYSLSRCHSSSSSQCTVSEYGLDFALEIDSRASFFTGAAWATFTRRVISEAITCGCRVYVCQGLRQDLKTQNLQVFHFFGGRRSKACVKSTFEFWTRSVLLMSAQRLLQTGRRLLNVSMFLLHKIPRTSSNGSMSEDDASAAHGIVGNHKSLFSCQVQRTTG